MQAVHGPYTQPPTLTLVKSSMCLVGILVALLGGCSNPWADGEADPDCPPLNPDGASGFLPLAPFFDQPVKDRLTQFLTAVGDTLVSQEPDGMGSYATQRGSVDDALSYRVRRSGNGADWPGSDVSGVERNVTALMQDLGLSNLTSGPWTIREAVDYDYNYTYIHGTLPPQEFAGLGFGSGHSGALLAMRNEGNSLLLSSLYRLDGVALAVTQDDAAAMAAAHVACTSWVKFDPDARPIPEVRSPRFFTAFERSLAYSFEFRHPGYGFYWGVGVDVMNGAILYSQRMGGV